MSRVSLQRAGIVTAFTLFYLATLTSDYYWDGITFALQIEKVARIERSPSVLFHQIWPIQPGRTGLVEQRRG